MKITKKMLVKAEKLYDRPLCVTLKRLMTSLKVDYDTADEIFYLIPKLKDFNQRKLLSDNGFYLKPLVDEEFPEGTVSEIIDNLKNYYDEIKKT